MTTDDPAVAAVHQFHGETCLCGFSSARARSRTEHIAELAAREALAPVYPLADQLRELHKPVPLKAQDATGRDVTVCNQCSQAGYREAWPTETDRLIWQLPKEPTEE